jgi:hypothetical protein
MQIGSNLDKRLEVSSPVNDSLHKKTRSTVVKKNITLLEGCYTLEDR